VTATAPRQSNDALAANFAVTTYCVHTFFDHYLKGTDGSTLTISSPRCPEIQILE
jgi:hypothetical protein